jgi:hypothetical protein
MAVAVMAVAVMAVAVMPLAVMASADATNVTACAKFATLTPKIGVARLTHLLVLSNSFKNWVVPPQTGV